jgi:hypothetical protein
MQDEVSSEETGKHKSIIIFEYNKSLISIAVALAIHAETESVSYKISGFIISTPEIKGDTPEKTIKIKDLPLKLMIYDGESLITEILNECIIKIEMENMCKRLYEYKCEHYKRK